MSIEVLRRFMMSTHKPAWLQAVAAVANDGLLKYLRHAGVYGQPELPSNLTTINNVTVVPIERLTDGAGVLPGTRGEGARDPHRSAERGAGGDDVVK